jgi:putative peptide zinc metalloprotease protein
MQTLTNILYIKVPITNVLVYFNLDLDHVLERMYRPLWWIFTTWFFAFSCLFLLSAVMLVGLHFDTFYDKLPSYHEFFSFKTVAFLWLALGIVKVIHEFGHGLSCKAFGGEVHEMGLLFLVFSPCMYCNVSDAWTLPNKWWRIIISFAGIYVEFFLIAPLATWIWWNTPADPFVNNMSLSLMIVCSVSTIVFNANPLMRYDGYYMLADWLEIPNLRDRSNRFLQRLAMDYCLGIEVQPEPYMALWRRILFVLYAIISYIYRWVITFSILYFMSMFLEPYKLGVISGMLALAAGASMVGWPLYRLGKNIHKRGRLPDMKPIRVTLTTIALTGVILFLFLVPLPVSRVRQLGLVQVLPSAQAKVYVPFPGGILKDLRVRDGQEVKQGDLLAIFTNVELELQMAQTEADLDSNRRTYNDLKQVLVERPDATNEARGQLLRQMADAEGKYKTAARLLEAYKAEKAQLEEVKAERDGIIMGPPRIDEIGKRFDKGTLLCTIGDPTHLRVLLPVSTADYRLLYKDLSMTSELPAMIRVQGHANRNWQGRVLFADLPRVESKRIPLPLTSKGGGNIAVMPTGKQDNEGGSQVPQNQQFLVPVELLSPEQSICPGTLAYVKVSCRYQTAVWWAWRSVSQLFDLGMDPTDWLPEGMRFSH